ncbi:hypothetical protein OROGR_026125 [Orobanche gracilis]
MTTMVQTHGSPLLYGPLWSPYQQHLLQLLKVIW